MQLGNQGDGSPGWCWMPTPLSTQPGGRFSWLALDADCSLVVEALASTPEVKVSATMSV